mmetsp:Transcript_10188/g.30669  ORF Transcript_10188/g.30669 Transcript_10188/m.30669 type:complete len:493 (+) Transcript_10188:998-2476(+)
MLPHGLQPCLWWYLVSLRGRPPGEEAPLHVVLGLLNADGHAGVDAAGKLLLGHPTGRQESVTVLPRLFVVGGDNVGDDRVEVGALGGRGLGVHRQHIPRPRAPQEAPVHPVPPPLVGEVVGSLVVEVMEIGAGPRDVLVVQLPRIHFRPVWPPDAEEGVVRRLRRRLCEAVAGVAGSATHAILRPVDLLALCQRQLFEGNPKELQLAGKLPEGILQITFPEYSVQAGIAAHADELRGFENCFDSRQVKLVDHLGERIFKLRVNGILLHARAQLVIVHLEPDLEVGAPGGGAPLQQGGPHHIHHFQVLLGVVHHRRTHLALQTEPHLGVLSHGRTQGFDEGLHHDIHVAPLPILLEGVEQQAVAPTSQPTPIIQPRRHRNRQACVHCRLEAHTHGLLEACNVLLRRLGANLETVAVLCGLPAGGSPLPNLPCRAGTRPQEEPSDDVPHPCLLGCAVVLLIEAEVLHLPLVVKILLCIHRICFEEILGVFGHPE